MTRDWITAASRRLRMVRSGSARTRRHHKALSLENLEHRLSLSSYSAGAVVGADLNPQPLPPNKAPMMRCAWISTTSPRPMLNPQPLPPREAPMLNPQPLPPHEAPMLRFDF
jgi:hypothetical protein